MLPLPTLLSHPRGIGTPLLFPILSPLLRNPKRPILRLRGRNSRVCICRSGRDPDRSTSDEDSNGRFFDLRRWDVPWDWKVTLYVMMPYLLSILFTGLVRSSGIRGEHPFFDNMLSQHLSDDEMAVRFFFNNLLKEVVKLSILYALISPYLPLPEDILSFRWNHPLTLQNGWIVWAAGGLVVASCSVFVLRSMLGFSARDLQNEMESLMQFLPAIGSSGISTGCLIGVLGVMAPICEEIIYRGFLLTSLTKWLPLHSSIIMSSAVFALAHQSPGKSLEIFIFGLVLGLVYSQTRNLLSPVLMHALWNLGVLLLSFLLSQSSEIHRAL